MNATKTFAGSNHYDVAVLGAGYAGLMAALRLRRAAAGRLRVALVNMREEFVERVRLQESVVAELPVRIPPLRQFLAGTNVTFIRGEVISLDPDARRIRISDAGAEHEFSFAQAIYALGSRVDVEDMPGAAAHAYRLDMGEGPRAAAALRARLHMSANDALRIVAIGGSETGVEVAGEIKSTWPMMQVTMISRSRCGEFKGQRVGQFVRAQLAGQGVHMIDGETVTEIGANEVRTESGRTIPFDVCVWSGGLRSPAIGRDAGLATDPHGRIFVDPNLRSLSHPHILAIGDAARPVAPTGAPYRLSAFAALTSGTHAAEVILAGLANRQLPPFSFSTFGQGISIGRVGVGYLSYPDDKPVLFILKGRTALHVRNVFVWIVAGVLKLERRFPGFFFWLGRKRVSWPRARSAMREVQTA